MNHVRSIDLATTPSRSSRLQFLADLRRDGGGDSRLFSLSARPPRAGSGRQHLHAPAEAQVLRYGNMRGQVLRLEVVPSPTAGLGRAPGPAPGQHGLRPQHLFIGAEGTLGIVTTAVLKLRPMPRSVATAFVAMPGPAESVALLRQVARGVRRARHRLRARLARLVLDLVLRNMVSSRDRFGPRPGTCCVELFDSAEGAGLCGLLEDERSAVPSRRAWFATR